MKQIRNALAVLVAFFSLGTVAVFAQAISEPQDPTQAMNLFPMLFDAIKSSQWTMVAAAGVMLLVFGVRKYVLPDMGAKVVPWLASALGVLGAIATNLGAGQDWGQALYSGVTVGVAASGFWSLVGQHIFVNPGSEASKNK